MPREAKDLPASVRLDALGDKLDDMTLHDETGDARDAGYMDAVRELREWATEQTDDPPHHFPAWKDSPV